MERRNTYYLFDNTNLEINNIKTTNEIIKEFNDTKKVEDKLQKKYLDLKNVGNNQLSTKLAISGMTIGFVYGFVKQQGRFKFAFIGAMVGTATGIIVEKLKKRKDEIGKPNL